MKKTAFLFIIVSGILWGSSGLFVNFLAPYGYTSLQMVAARGLFSAISMVIYTFFYDRSLFRANGRELFLYALSGLSMFGAASSYYTSMQHTSVATAVVLMYTAPVFVMIYSVLFLGEKLNGMKLISVVGMLTGCVLVSGIIGGASGSGFGIFIGLMAGISYSAYNIFTKIQMGRPCHPLTATMYCMVFMAIIALSFAKPVEMVAVTGQKPLFLLPMLISLALFTGVLPYFLYTLALKTLPAGTATALGIIEPMAATVMSVLFLKEPLPLFPFLGILCILGSVFLLSRSEDFYDEV